MEALLQADSWQSCEKATQALVDLGNKAVVDALIQSLGDRNEMVHWHAVSALGQLGDKSAVMPLVNLLTNDKNEGVRVEAGYALANLADKRAIEPLLKLLTSKDENPLLRAAALDILGLLKEPGVVATLLQILHDDDPDLRYLTAQTLGKLGNPEILPELRELAQNDAQETSTLDNLKGRRLQVKDAAI